MRRRECLNEAIGDLARQFALKKKDDLQSEGSTLDDCE